jgi:hypothetical protein
MLADGGSIVLYSEKQLEDLRSMCCTGQSILDFRHRQDIQPV